MTSRIWSDNNFTANCPNAFHPPGPSDWNYDGIVPPPDDPGLQLVLDEIDKDRRKTHGQR
jgi:hypothetical protein